MHNRVRWIITRVFVLLLALALLWLLFAPVIEGVAERAFRPPVTCGPPYELVAGSYRLEGSRPFDGGIAVLYSAQCAQPGQAPVPLDGVYLRTGRSVFADGQDGSSSIGAAPVGQLLSYSQSRGGWVNENGQNTGVSLISGRIYAPSVTVVEATFANGQIQRDTTGSAVFAIVIPADVPACELRALDANAKILARIDLSSTGGKDVPECHQKP